MSSAPLISNVLKTVSQDGDTKTSSSTSSSASSKAGHKQDQSDEAFYASLQRALKGEASKREAKIQEKQPAAKEKNAEEATVHSTQETGSPNHDAFSSVQAALMISGQIPVQAIDAGQASRAMSEAYEDGGNRGLSARGKTSAWSTLPNAQDATDVLSKGGENAALSGAGSAWGGTSAGLNSLASNGAPQDFSNLLEQFGKGSKIQADGITQTPSSQLSLSISGLSSLSTHAMPSEQSQAGLLAVPLKEVQDALKDYWVPPVQVSSQSPTEATVSMNLREGGVLTLHFQLSEGQGAQLRVEAPAAALAALQARLAPLQESLLQQGLTLAPIQWGTAKTPSGRGSGAVDSVKGRLISSAADQLEKDKLADLTEDAVYATTAAEDLLE